MNNKFKCASALIIFIILTILGFILFPKEDVIINEDSEEIDDFIFVHVDGCVNEPGLIKVKYGTRVYELIDEAGGETEDADLSRINLATIVNDGQKIIIPAKVVLEENVSDLEKDALNEHDEGAVNINTASKEKLISLSGIGDSTAQKIIDYRNENGFFNSIEDIMNVQGIGESKFNKIKDDITV